MKRAKRPRPEENPGGDDLDDFGLRLEDRVEAVDPKATEMIPEDATLTEAKQDINKPKKKRRRKGTLAGEVAKDIGVRTSAEQAQWLCNSFAASTGASILEQSWLEVPCIAQIDTSVALEQQLIDYKSSWRKHLLDNPTAVRERGAPLVILVAASAVQANNLAKHLPRINKACRIAKLFAKHFKVEEQRKVLQEAVVNVATGTPNRLVKLAEDGCLSVKRLGLVIFDVAMDAKMRTLLDVPEVRKDLWEFMKKFAAERLEAGSTMLALIDSSKLHPS